MVGAGWNVQRNIVAVTRDNALATRSDSSPMRVAAIATTDVLRHETETVEGRF